MYIYLNGQFVKKEAALISPFDHGFLYGMGLFETFRVYERHPFLLDDHLQRLNQGLAELKINHHFSSEETNITLQKLLEINRLTNAYIRFNVSAGIGEVGLQVEPYDKPNLMIFPKSLPAAGAMLEKKAVLLRVKRNTPEGSERLKSHHFMNNILAKREIGGADDQEGIFLSMDGYVAEGIVSNVFWIKQDTLFTPSLNTGILNGITRQFVIELAREIGINVQEGQYKYDEVLKAEEVFVTNSIQEIVPISTFQGQRMPGKEGQFVQKLHQIYRQYSTRLWSRTEVKSL